MAGRVLVVADMLFDFIDPAGALYCGPRGEAVVPRIRDLLDDFRGNGEHVVYLRDQHAPDDREFRLYGRHSVAGSPESRIIEPLAPRPGEQVVAKRFFSGMKETRLPHLLVELGAREIHLSGVCTSICVMLTATDLVERDYGVVVHEDAVADFDMEMHACALEWMKRVLKVRMEGAQTAVPGGSPQTPPHIHNP